MTIFILRASVGFLGKLQGCDERRQAAYVAVAERSEVFGHAVYWSPEIIQLMGNLIGMQIRSPQRFRARLLLCVWF